MNFKLRKLNVKQYLWSLILAFLFVMSLLIPCVSNYKYFEQNLELVDLPPILKLKKLKNTMKNTSILKKLVTEMRIMKIYLSHSLIRLKER